MCCIYVQVVKSLSRLVENSVLNSQRLLKFENGSWLYYTCYYCTCGAFHALVKCIEQVRLERFRERFARCGTQKRFISRAYAPQAAQTPENKHSLPCQRKLLQCESINTETKKRSLLSSPLYLTGTRKPESITTDDRLTVKTDKHTTSTLCTHKTQTKTHHRRTNAPQTSLKNNNRKYSPNTHATHVRIHDTP
jgi:hypothetical protein